MRSEGCGGDRRAPRSFTPKQICTTSSNPRQRTIDMPAATNNASSEPVHAASVARNAPARFALALGLALVATAGVWGAKTAFKRSADEWPTTVLDLAQLAALIALLAVGLLTCCVVVGRLVGYKRRLEKQRQEHLVRLQEAARSDSLTGLGNHRAFQEDLKREIERRGRSGTSFSLVMLDLDAL